MQVTIVEPLKCPECQSVNASSRSIPQAKPPYKIISCFDCRKDYSTRDGKATEHKNQPFYGKSGTHIARYQMGDYGDHKGI